MTPATFIRTMAMIGHLPGFLAGPATQIWFAVARYRNCSRGHHLHAGGNYCSFDCGTLLKRDAWRQWTVGLRDGSFEVVSATAEHHARNLVVYGQQTPGMMDTAAFDAGRHRVMMSDIISCQAGQICEAPGQPG